MNKILFAIAVFVSTLSAQIVMVDTIPRVIIYGVSNDPFTYTDTVTGICRRSGDKMYIKTTDGRNIFAAWTIEKNINKGEVK